ncbi:MAG: hypothetical protein HY287_09725 [Planctomycetes bacterium]|nr:hypothetical protein [Planctomycetota bacterium]MBI3834592.1 hypothetical protein [Planctomycetota bacterium]
MSVQRMRSSDSFIALSIAAFVTTMLAGVGVAIPPRHEKAPTMPWIKPVPVSTQNVAGNHAPCASHVTRDGYTSIQVNVDTYGCNIPGDAGNEPSIAIDPTDPKKIVIGWRQFDSVLSDFRQAGWAYSHDAGHTWVIQGSLTPGVFGSDPVLAAGPTGEVYYLSVGLDELRLFKSLDGGMSWLQRFQVAPGLQDKPWMAIDTTKGVGRGNIYVLAPYYDLHRSTDSGRTFENIPWPTNVIGTAIYVDGSGTLYTYPPIVRSETVQDLSATPTFQERSYFLCTGPLDCATGNPNPGGEANQYWIGSATDIHHIAWLFVSESPTCFSRTQDGGITFDTPIRINDDPLDNGACHWFTMLSVAQNGRVDMAWNDTRNYTDDPDAKLSELYYSHSIDYGATWSANVPVSLVFNTYIGWAYGQNKIGDYYHMLSDNLGVNIAYAATFNGEQDVYFLRIGPWDCNGNQIDDAVDIASATSLDCNGNGVPDECEYRADFDGDGLTTYNDFATFVGNFAGPIVRETASAPRERGGSGTNCSVLSDIDHDGDVDLKDFYGLQQVFVTP